MELKPADILFVHSRSVLGKLIRFCTRSIGEPKTVVNHVGIIVLGDCYVNAVLVEALSKVRLCYLSESYGDRLQDIYVYRANNLTPEEIATITKKAWGYVSANYGYIKLVAHLLDWCCFDVYFFRRMARMDKYPICSWLVAHCYAAAGKNFGVEPGAANPDDIWDFVQSYPEIYSRVEMKG